MKNRESGLFSPGPLGQRFQQALEEMARDGVVERIWRGDYTLWSDDPAEITRPNRLGWLHVVDSMRDETASLRRFAIDVAGDGYRKLVLFGMGGSSLAPEVLQRTFGSRPGLLELEVMDTTHPDGVLELADRLDLQRTLFIVASKSGSTIETLTHLDYFWSLIPDGRHFVAITDEGSALHHLGEERGFRRVFLNQPDIGGRYSALSYFGLVPAALIGVNLDKLLSQAASMAAICRNEELMKNSGALLGAMIGEAALAGRDKLTLLLSPELASFGDWVEQLVAESTGKEGRGIVPVVGEPVTSDVSRAEDRLFVDIGAGNLFHAEPSFSVSVSGKERLGAEFFRWEFATAVAAQRLRINPFDQPNVQSAKDATSRILGSGVTEAEATPSIAEVLASVQPGDYIALLAYMPRNADTEAALQALRMDLRKRFGVATTLGFGPRYLHSTGQLHKGGPNSGVFILLTDDPARDGEVPGRPYTFARLHRAQALGELQSLLALGRRVAHVHLKGERVAAIAALREGIS